MSLFLTNLRRKAGIVEESFPWSVSGFNRSELTSLESRANDLQAFIAWRMTPLSVAVSALITMTAAAVLLQFTLAAITAGCLAVIAIVRWALVYTCVYRWIAKHTRHYQNELNSRNRDSSSYI